jgi:hypothetical protein
LNYETGVVILGMMKLPTTMRLPMIALAAFLLLLSCNQPSAGDVLLKQQVDTLQQQLKNVYRPGLGEFMLGIQTHHAKLWFAGKAQNWDLAKFEIEEIEETIADIKQYCADRPEVKSIGMIDMPLDSLNQAIQTRNEAMFTSKFTLLTNTCNNCHVANQHGFNVITIPGSPPVSNQKFGL